MANDLEEDDVPEETQQEKLRKKIRNRLAQVQGQVRSDAFLKRLAQREELHQQVMTNRRAQLAKNETALAGTVPAALPNETDDQAQARIKLRNYLATQRDPRFAKMLNAPAASPPSDDAALAAKQAMMSRMAMVGAPP